MSAESAIWTSGVAGAGVLLELLPPPPPRQPAKAKPESTIVLTASSLAIGRDVFMKMYLISNADHPIIGDRVR